VEKRGRRRGILIADLLILQRMKRRGWRGTRYARVDIFAKGSESRYDNGMKNLTERDSRKSPLAEREEEILAFWHERDIFAKSLAKNTKNKEHFVFYDGPPFATGLPHYGHILSGIIKDAIPRYETMRGKYVRRIWGWDCHGLPIENLIEKELGLLHKSDIEKLGIGKFNAAARESVLRYDNEWKKTIPRIGRWIDMDASYRTMDWRYTESIWWAFKTLHDKDLIYQGYKSMHICPRCETTLANTEVTLGYKDITDISVTVKFELEDKPGTHMLAWTTTPWTLPGNVALAVGEDVAYVEVALRGAREDHFILAKDRARVTLGEYDIVRELKGKDLIGKRYKPLFDYYANDISLENRENGWKIYPADFVTTGSGTGIVHIAPAFGEDDMELGKKKRLPFVQHVSMDGKFAAEVKDFAGEQVKPKDDHQKTDIEIIKFLSGKGLLFSKEKITHPYPHCWRCDTPLLNYAASSWFVKVTAIKDRLLEVNATVQWVPETIKDGRFGKWLEGARDWAISRARFWGAPLPVWKCGACEKQEIIGSVDDIKKRIGAKNNFYLMRHGEAENNTMNVMSSRPDNQHHLTENGKASILRSAKQLKDKKIDIIISSPFVRTKETATILASELGISSAVIFDSRLGEIGAGEFEGKSVDAYRGYFSSTIERFVKAPQGAENVTNVRRRAMDALFEANEKYIGKNIVIVTHESPAWMLVAGSRGLDTAGAAALREDEGTYFIKNGEIMELPFIPFPHDDHYEIDLHKPFIDEVKFTCACGGEMSRVTDVFDCWFESGSMPYAQFHYPFENEDIFKRNFPADFIAEGLDQTRGWFYNMLVLSVGLFDTSAFKNVIVNGMILAEDGQKMSKRLKNYPEPMNVINRYSADALRYYLLSSPVSHGEELNFSEKGVDEAQKKIVIRLLNVLSFYDLYRDAAVKAVDTSSNALDRWIVARVGELLAAVDDAFNTYLLDRAIRAIGEFVDDLSTWYVRRSRSRFKSDDIQEKNKALATLRYVLGETAMIIAPTMPFLAEELYARVGGTEESVHLEAWPKQGSVDKEILVSMKFVRSFAAMALMERARHGIKVRQPLRKLTIGHGGEKPKEWDKVEGILADEINVKEIEFVNGAGANGSRVVLDTIITPELKKEGMFRELMRTIQDGRKQKNFVPTDCAILTVKTDTSGKAFVKEFTENLKRVSGIKEVRYSGEDQEQDVDLGDIRLQISLCLEE